MPIVQVKAGYIKEPRRQSVVMEQVVEQVERAEVLELNVGGVLYTTTRQTLTKYTNSTLANIFSADNLAALPRDKDGRYFLDRDGDLFSHVLAFLRCDQCHLPPVFDEGDRLLTECRYYGVDKLAEHVEGLLGCETDVMLFQKDDVKPTLYGCLISTIPLLNKFLSVYRLKRDDNVYIRHIQGNYGILTSSIDHPLHRRKIRSLLQQQGWICIPSSAQPFQMPSSDANEIYDKYMKLSAHTFSKCCM